MKLLAGIIAVLLTFACEDTKEESGGGAASAVNFSEKIQEFKALKAEATPVEAADFEFFFVFLAYHTFQSEFRTQEPAVDSAINCNFTEIENAFKLEAAGTLIRLSIDYEISDTCMAELKDTTDPTYGYMNYVKGEFTTLCENDVSQFDGTSPLDFTEEDCGKILGRGGFTEQQFIRVGVDPIAAPQEVYTLQDLMASETSGLCSYEYSEQTFTKSNCIQGLYNSFTRDGVLLDSTYLMSLSQGVSGVVGDQWYTAGLVDLEYNDWDGQLTFNAEGTAPSYSMTKGDSVIEGQLAEPTFLHHRSEWKSRFFR